MFVKKNPSGTTIMRACVRARVCVCVCERGGVYSQARAMYVASPCLRELQLVGDPFHRRAELVDRLRHGPDK